MQAGNKERGRILRLKQGYNPNSSSVGSQIPTFLAFAVGAGVFAVFILHAFVTASRLLRRRSREERVGDKEPGE